MAKFRKKSRSRFGGFKRYARRASPKFGSGALIQPDAMVYGAVRAPISQWVQKTVPLPIVGDIGDELAMGAINWLVAKNMSGFARNVALKGLVIENARVGEALSSGMLAKASNGSSGYVYG